MKFLFTTLLSIFVAFLSVNAQSGHIKVDVTDCDAVQHDSRSNPIFSAEAFYMGYDKANKCYKLHIVVLMTLDGQTSVMRTGDVCVPANTVVKRYTTNGIPAELQAVMNDCSYDRLIQTYFAANPVAKIKPIPKAPHVLAMQQDKNTKEIVEKINVKN